MVGPRQTDSLDRLLTTSVGPLIRISPDELHCNDPEFIDAVYPHGRQRRDKSRHYLAGMPLGYVVLPLCLRRITFDGLCSCA